MKENTKMQHDIINNIKWMDNNGHVPLNVYPILLDTTI